MKFFDTQPKPGMPVRHSTFYRAIVRMVKAWEKLEVYNGHVDWSNGMPTIVMDQGVAGGVGEFSGNVWVGGAKVTVPEATTDYLKVPFDGSACTWVGAIPDTMDEDAEVFDITQTAGDIHLPGNYGRNS